jgi:hypothetical protein
MIHLGVFSREEVQSFLESQILQSSCRDSVREEDQDPLHKQWGVICE